MSGMYKIYDITSDDITELLQAEKWANEFTDIDSYVVEYSPYDELKLKQLPDTFTGAEMILVLISRNNKTELFQYTRYKQTDKDAIPENEFHVFKYTKGIYFVDILDESNLPLLPPFAKARYHGRRLIVTLLAPQKLTEHMEKFVYIKTICSIETPTRYRLAENPSNIYEGETIEYEEA